MGEFPDLSKIDPYIEDITPAITMKTADGTSSRTLAAHQWDGKARDEVGVGKSRLLGVNDDRKSSIQGLSENIILLPDHNRPAGTYLAFYPSNYKEQIFAIMRPETQVVHSNIGNTLASENKQPIR